MPTREQAPLTHAHIRQVTAIVSSRTVAVCAAQQTGRRTGAIVEMSQSRPARNRLKLRPEHREEVMEMRSSKRQIRRLNRKRYRYSDATVKHGVRRLTRGRRMP
jgi:hypothetical protein